MTIINSEHNILFQNQFVTVYHTPVPNTERLYTVVQPRGGQGGSVIPIIPPSEAHPYSRFLVLNQHRPPISGASWEFPAGAVDEGEDPSIGAARELTEEAGINCQPENLVSLGIYYNNPTLANDTVFLYAYILPSDFDASTVTVQEEEIDDYVWLSTQELLEKCFSNPEFSVTMPAALMKLRKMGLIEPLGL